MTQLDVEASTPSAAVAFTAALNTSLVGGQQVEGLFTIKPLVRVGDVDWEEPADEKYLGDPNPVFDAGYNVATEFPSKHDQEAATVVSADVWKEVEGELEPLSALDLLARDQQVCRERMVGAMGEPVSRAQPQAPCPEVLETSRSKAVLSLSFWAIVADHWLTR